jgi:hypothetical protein
MKVYCITDSDAGFNLGELLRQRFEIPHVPMQLFKICTIEEFANIKTEDLLIYIKDSSSTFSLNIDANFTLDLDESKSINDYVISLFSFLSENGLEDDNWKTKTGLTSLIDHMLNIESVNWQCPCGQCSRY